MAQVDAVRLLNQATFGPTEVLIKEVAAMGAGRWLKNQQTLAVSQYTLGKGGALHRNASTADFCSTPTSTSSNCWRDWYSTEPLLWDFYRNAMGNPDQLRQRIAFALQQILVVSGIEVQGTYGFRNYQNDLLNLSFDNYRAVLRKVMLSPVMGDYLNNVNNDSSAPNENFAREFLELFSLGTCLLNPDGTPKGGTCAPVYDNFSVREYAYALTGWTYPAGGSTSWGCLPKGANCQSYDGDMVPLPMLRDKAARRLLSGVSVPANASAPVAMELVLDSVMGHPNMAPFVARHLIQHLVGSNPSSQYVQRVADAFRKGSFQSDSIAFGQGKTGDLAATVAAVLLDSEARTGTTATQDAGTMREPVLYFTGVLRALNGTTDGQVLGDWWGATLNQHLFRAPSVFNFYPASFPVAGTALNGSAFAIHDTSTSLERINFLSYLLQWGGSGPDKDIPGATGTRVSTSAFENDASDPGLLVDRLAILATGAPFPPDARSFVVQATETIRSESNPQWKADRVKQAAYLIFSSPAYQVYR